MSFAVIEFADGNWSAIIRTNWLLEMEDATFVYWPKTHLARQAAIKGAVPDKKTWKLEKLKRVYIRCDSYEAATKHEETFLVTSDLDTDVKEKDVEEPHFPEHQKDGGEPPKKRAHAEEQISHSDSRDEEEESLDPKLPPPPRSHWDSRVTQQRDLQDETQETENDNTSSDSSPQMASRVEDSSSVEVQSDTQSTSACSCSIQKVMDQNEELLDQNKKLMKKINLLIANQDRFLQQPQLQQQQQRTVGMEDILMAKAKTLEDFQAWEDSLGCDTLALKTFKHLYGIVGTDLNKTLSKLLDRVASNGVWELYSQKGKSGKLSLIDTKPRIYNLIKHICFKKYAKSEAEFMESMQNLLKSANIKEGGSKFKSRKSKSNAPQSHSSVEETRLNNIFASQ